MNSIIGPTNRIRLPIGTSRTFTVKGGSFFQITNVYLSGAPYLNSTFYNPFSGIPSLSAKNPGFFGVKLLSTEYQGNNLNSLVFTMPSAQQPGLVDIILENQAGWSALTQNIIFTVITTNPFSPEYPEHDDYLLKMKPWSRGITVFESTSSVTTEDELLPN
jgi:hypothetical protein